MNGVTLSTASPAAPQPASLQPRGGGSPARTAAGPAPSAKRMHASSRADAPSASATPRDDERFASVLAAARESVSDTPAVDDRASSREGAATRTAGESGDVPDDELLASLPQGETRQHPPATSWLLLALQHAPLVRPGEAAASHEGAAYEAANGGSAQVAGAGETASTIAAASALLTGFAAVAGGTGDPAGAPGSATLTPPRETTHAADDALAGGEAVAAGPLVPGRLVVDAVRRGEPADEGPSADRVNEDVTSAGVPEAAVGAETVSRWSAVKQTLVSDSGNPAETRGEAVAVGDAPAGREPGATRVAGVPGAVSSGPSHPGRIPTDAPQDTPVATPAVAPATESTIGQGPVEPSGGRAWGGLPGPTDGTPRRQSTDRQDVGGPAGGETPGVLAVASGQPAGAPRSEAAAPSVPTAAAAPLPPAVGEQVATQIVSSLKMQWKDGIGEARLHLRPDALGAVTVLLRVEQGAVTAVVRADSPQVQDWVIQHQQTLRQQMEAAGLRLDDLSVNPDDKQQHQPQHEQPEQRRRRAHRHQAPPDGRTFELLA